MNLLRTYLILASVLFVNHAVANDQAAQQKLFRYAVNASPACKTVPVDVPQSIIYRDGQAVMRAPANFGEFQDVYENAQLQTELQNCLAQVSNVLQTHSAELSEDLKSRLQRATATFFTSIHLIVNSNKGPRINKDVFNKENLPGQMGIRG